MLHKIDWSFFYEHLEPVWNIVYIYIYLFNLYILYVLKLLFLLFQNIRITSIQRYISGNALSNVDNNDAP